MSKLYEDNCPRCGGSGVVYHGNITLRVQGREDRYCFKCLGSGKVYFKTSPEQREKNREAARKRRLAKWEADRDARLEKERAENNGYTLAELAEIEEKKRKEQQEREWAVSQWLGSVGEKISLTGTCLFARTYQGFYGYSTFYIIETESGDIVKFSTSGQTFDCVGKGSIVEMTGKVKNHEVNPERDNQKVTVLERVKCQDTYRIVEEGAA
mgnify:CR=1 FL=1